MVHFRGAWSWWFLFCVILIYRNCALPLLELYCCHSLLDQGGRWVSSLPMNAWLFLYIGWCECLGCLCLQIQSCSSLLQSMLCLEFPFLTWCGIDPSIVQWGMLSWYHFSTSTYQWKKDIVSEFIIYFRAFHLRTSQRAYIFLFPKCSLQTCNIY